MKCQPLVTQKAFYLLYANNRRKSSYPVSSPIPHHVEFIDEKREALK
jgi:hypothetical protein